MGVAITETEARELLAGAIERGFPLVEPEPDTYLDRNDHGAERPFVGDAIGMAVVGLVGAEAAIAVVNGYRETTDVLVGELTRRGLPRGEAEALVDALECRFMFGVPHTGLGADPTWTRDVGGEEATRRTAAWLRGGS